MSGRRFSSEDANGIPAEKTPPRKHVSGDADDDFEIRVVTTPDDPTSGLSKKEVLDVGRKTIKEQRKRTEQRTGTRVVAFFDAVMAIAITLLALEIAIPEVEALTLGELESLFLPFTALFISFLALGQAWFAHVKAFSQMEYSSSNLTTVGHLVLMFFVVLFPKTTELIATYPHSTSAIVVYLICFFAMVITEGVLIGSARKQQLDTLERIYAERNLPNLDKATLAMLAKETAEKNEDFKVLVKSFLRVLKMESLTVVTSFVTTGCAVIFLFVNPFCCYLFFLADIVISSICYHQIKVSFSRVENSCEACSVSLFEGEDEDAKRAHKRARKRRRSA